MATRMQKLRDAIVANDPESRLEPMTAAQLKRLLAEHQKTPAHLRDFYAQGGCGSIGNSRYMIYPPLSPLDVFDAETAAGSQGVLLVGDDFAGTHEAYDTRGRSWRFGTVGGGGTFRPSARHKDFPAFIAGWYGSPAGV
jgi:hypothetical protein